MKISKESLASFNRGDFSNEFYHLGLFSGKEFRFLTKVRYSIHGVLAPTEVTQKDIKEYRLKIS